MTFSFARPASFLDRIGPVRSFLAVPLLVAPIWLGWQIVVAAVSDFYALSDPEIALAWDPAHTEALVDIAEDELLSVESPTTPEELAGIAEAALLGDPLNPVPLRILGLLAEAAGDPARAESLMRMAIARSLRDFQAMMWLADLELSTGDVSGALAKVDGALRVVPETGEEIFPMLAELAVPEETRGALIELLGFDPSWRGSFLAALPGLSADPAGLAEFYSGLAGGQAPLRNEELRPYLQSLIDGNEVQLARSIWVGVRPNDQPAAELLHNGGFEVPLSGLPFDWTIGRVRGADAEVALAQTGSRALRVQFHNTRVPFRHVSQVLTLDPGGYQLSGRVQANNLVNERGLQWSVTCAGEGGILLGETERVAGTLPWLDFTAPFVVPDDENCQAQVLRLELAARIAAEQEISGDIWYDDLRIEAGPM